jgi:hypothetical protein
MDSAEWEIPSPGSAGALFGRTIKPPMTSAAPVINCRRVGAIEGVRVAVFTFASINAPRSLFLVRHLSIAAKYVQGNSVALAISAQS